MPIYKGSSIISKITRGGRGVDAVYRGASLIYSARTFPKDTIIANSATGNETGSFTLKNKQKFYVEMYGGGAGGSNTLATYVKLVANTPGNTGATSGGSYNVSGGASVYSSYGRGQNAYGDAGVAGYIKIVTA